MADKPGQHKGKDWGTPTNRNGLTRRKWKRMMAKNGGSTKSIHQSKS